jgi:hypothetical protein
MDKLTDFFKELRDRLSNPLFSSFLIAWLVINWQIPIALLFYSNETLRADGYNSYFDLIDKKYSVWYYFIYPVIVALFYTFVFPLFRNVIFAFQSWIQSWGTKWIFNISKKGKISMERYIQLREKYLKQIKTVEEVFTQEADYLTQNKELNIEKTKLSTENNKLSSDLSNWQSMNDPRILNGDWDYTFKPSESDSPRHYRLQIFGDQVYFFSDASKRTKIEEYHLSDFFCNPFHGKLCFTLSSVSKGHKIYHNLSFPNGIAELVGTEDHTRSIFYRKVAE